jgi:predicted RNA-binding Zn ribbon-like protein
MLISNYRCDLALAFANTRYWRGSAQPTDELSDIAVLLDWLAKNGALDAREQRALAAWTRKQAGEAAALFEAAVGLRETLYRVFGALAAEAAPKAPDVAALRRAIAAAPPRSDLTPAKDGYVWQVSAPRPIASDLLAPVLWSAADLLVGEATQRLRLCSNDKCLYLFLDHSRSGARRWCDMKACGNRAKAHRHYLRSKAA